MWMELLEIFRSGDPLKALADDFMEMLRLTREMAEIVRPRVFDHMLSLEKRKEILRRDIEVNKLERSIRKRLVAHLTMQGSQAPFCLLLFSLVKDAERIGDYVKNIAEVERLGGAEIPAGPLRDELSDLIDIATKLQTQAPEVLAKQDRERATVLIREGQSGAKRSDTLLVELAKSDFNAAQTTSMVLLTRFYKRIIAHLVNILSSVVMPVHKVDFFDEEYVEDVDPDQAVGPDEGEA